MGKILQKNQVLSSPVFPLNVLVATIENPMPEHYHEFYEMIIVLKGRGIQRINGIAVEMKAGNVFVLKEKENHLKMI